MSQEGTTCWTSLPGRELSDHLEGGRVDDPDVTAVVRHVDQRPGGAAAGAEHPGAGLGVDVARVGHRRHAGKLVGNHRGGRTRRAGRRRAGGCDAGRRGGGRPHRGAVLPGCRHASGKQCQAGPDGGERGQSPRHISLHVPSGTPNALSRLPGGGGYPVAASTCSTVLCSAPPAVGPPPGRNSCPSLTTAPVPWTDVGSGGKAVQLSVRGS